MHAYIYSLTTNFLIIVVNKAGLFDEEVPYIKLDKFSAKFFDVGIA